MPEPNILNVGMINFALPDVFISIIATAEAARKLRIDQKRSRKRIETKHQISVPQVNYGILQVWREMREDSPIHAIGIEIWDGHTKLAVVQPVHCAGWLPSQVHEYLRQALTVLDTEYGFKKFVSQVLINPEQCPIRLGCSIGWSNRSSFCQ
jgi:hypothetical protein